MKREEMISSMQGALERLKWRFVCTGHNLTSQGFVITRLTHLHHPFPIPH